MSELVGPFIELPVSKLPVFENNGDAIRGLCRLPVKAVDDRFVAGIIRLGVIEPEQELPALCRSKQLQVAYPGCPLFGDLQQYLFEMCQQPLDIGFFYKVNII